MTITIFFFGGWELPSFFFFYKNYVIL
jgi:hypothetical protein